MIPLVDLRLIAKARFKDAMALLKAERHDGCVYICGYAVEIALKARICRHLKWQGYPQSSKEFQNYQSFKTHNFDTLLSLCGVESLIKNKYLAEWSVAAAWEPEMRYRGAGSVSRQDAELMVEAVRTLLGKL